MKRKLWTLLLTLGAALALCVGASATHGTKLETSHGGQALSSGEYYLDGDVTILQTITVNGTVTLDLNGHVLKYENSTTNGSVLVVEGSGNLTIKDSNSNATHKFTPDANGLWVLDENGSETVSGGIITGGTGYLRKDNNIDIESGGGVYVAPNGQLTMSGGNIVGCYSAVYGGGVYLEGTFTMKGGNIVGCTAMQGGGVYMEKTNKGFSMSGNAVIHSCRCITNSDFSNDVEGGGVLVLGSFTMSGNAAIRDCECSSDSRAVMGGGVYASYHTNADTVFTMSEHAVIENCKVTTSSQSSWIKSQGGGVYVSGGASLTLKDNTKIKGCSAMNTAGGATHGGGIFANSGSITIEGSAEVGENRTAGSGSGIYMEVSSNSSASQDLYANGGVVKGEVVLNNSSNCGGTIEITGSGEGATVFEGTVRSNSGTIEKGLFNGEVINNGTITGGTFTDTSTVTNNGVIKNADNGTGPNFSGTVINGEGGTIAEGVSIATLKFIVTFDNEGTKTAVTADNGGTVAKPDDPTKSGYTFDGWYYTEDNAEKEWNFGTDTVTRTMTLTAKWVQTYTVTFDTNGGSAVDPVTVDANSPIAKPADPAKDGYTFGGWYKENTFQIPWSFDTDTVTENLTLYAKWTAIPSTPSYDDSEPTYTVSAPKAENGKITVSPRYAERGERVTVTLTPDEGYELDSLTVTDSRGDALELTDLGGGKYRFTMPARRVEVKASFVKTVEVSPFDDVAIDAYYYEAIKWAVRNGIADGMGDSLFAPGQPCTRAQIVTFLWRAAGSPEPKGDAAGMTDVLSGSYYEKAVAWAIENGVTTGTGEGKFSPDATCTRAQAVTFLARALNAKASGKAEFSDVPTGSYFAEAVAWAAANGVTEGVGVGLFAPDNDCTRGQIVTFLYRAYNR